MAIFKKVQLPKPLKQNVHVESSSGGAFNTIRFWLCRLGLAPCDFPAS